MDDFDNPMKTSLFNRYDILNLELNKKRVETYKFTGIMNDVGWFLNDILQETFLSSDTTLSDFALKDKWSQDILFSKFIYVGKKIETYTRFYTKIQEVFAAIGGFSKMSFCLEVLLKMKSSNEGRNSNFGTRIKSLKIKFNKLQTEKPKQINYGHYLSYRICCAKVLKGNHKIKKTLDNYDLYKNYFNNALDILTYLNLYNQFKQLKKLILDKSERTLLKSIRPTFKKLNIDENSKLNSFSSKTDLINFNILSQPKVSRIEKHIKIIKIEAKNETLKYLNINKLPEE